MNQYPTMSELIRSNAPWPGCCLCFGCARYTTSATLDRHRRFGCFNPRARPSLRSPPLPAPLHLPWPEEIPPPCASPAIEQPESPVSGQTQTPPATPPGTSVRFMACVACGKWATRKQVQEHAYTGCNEEMRMQCWDHPEFRKRYWYYYAEKLDTQQEF
ncbi:hypothetical protein FRC12_006826 [Ceratobasidium sp. 428]|nr:hypothetical protein FRC12_006826 [Ceratobasidium sp. 428]